MCRMLRVISASGSRLLLFISWLCGPARSVLLTMNADSDQQRCNQTMLQHLEVSTPNVPIHWWHLAKLSCERDRPKERDVRNAQMQTANWTQTAPKKLQEAKLSSSLVQRAAERRSTINDQRSTLTETRAASSGWGNWELGSSSCALPAAGLT